MIEHTGRTIIGSIVFLDIVAYTMETDARQMSMKRGLNDIMGQAVANIAEAERIILDTGDGAAICFLGDPEDALFVATAVMDAVRKQTDDARQVLRVGINLGPVKIITDLNDHPNVVGDGINVAQRIMSFADDDEILVSRSYYEVVARLKEGNEQLFRYMGAKKDKHIREHQVYAFAAEGLPAVSAGKRIEAGDEIRLESPEPQAPEPQESNVYSKDFLDAVEHKLSELIGPLARVIVRRAAASAKSTKEFYATVASVIHDDSDRTAFLAETSAFGAPQVSGQIPSERTEPGQRVELSARDLTLAEQRLAQYIGPLAGVLVRRAATAAIDLSDLYARLAEHLDNDADKKRFLAAAMAED